MSVRLPAIDIGGPDFAYRSGAARQTGPAAPVEAETASLWLASTFASRYDGRRLPLQETRLSLMSINRHGIARSIAVAALALLVLTLAIGCAPGSLGPPTPTSAPSLQLAATPTTPGAAVSAIPTRIVNSPNPPLLPVSPTAANGMGPTAAPAATSPSSSSGVAPTATSNVQPAARGATAASSPVAPLSVSPSATASPTPGTSPTSANLPRASVTPTLQPPPTPSAAGNYPLPTSAPYVAPPTPIGGYPLPVTSPALPPTAGPYPSPTR